MKKFSWKTFFFIGLAIRIACFCLNPLSPATDLFIPFIDRGILDPFSNPWSLSDAHFFPYGSVLYFILFFPKFIFYKIFGANFLGSTLPSVGVLRLILLLADLALLKILFKLNHDKKNKLLWFYWLNPAIIFINYYLIQLDIFVALFTILAVLSIQKKQPFYFSALFLALAVLCKFPAIVLAPLFLAYIWNTQFLQNSLKSLSAWLIVFLGIVVLGFTPHFLSNVIGHVSVSSPEALRVFSYKFDLGNGVQFYIGLTLFFVALIRLMLSSKMTARGLFYSCGFLFGVLIISTQAAPGWYFWILPFFALFLAQYRTRSEIFLIAACFFYLILFSELIEQHLGVTLSNQIRNLVFTLLQVCIAAILFLIWKYVIRIEMPLSRRNRPFLIGIAGDSGSGKNTLSESLRKLFNDSNSVFLEGDDYHKWERGNEKWQDYSHLNPRANHLQSLIQDVLDLSRGQSINRSQYDHETGQFTESRLIETSRTIIIQGLHTFYPVLLRNSFDFKIYTEPDEQLRIFWKIKRDVLERGANFEKVKSSIENRRRDAHQHIAPQKGFGDWIIQSASENKIFEDWNHLKKLLSEPKILEPKIYQRHLISNDVQMDRLYDRFCKIKTLQVTYIPLQSDPNFMSFEIHGDISSEQIAKIAAEEFSDLRQLTRSYWPPQWQDNFSGINQLICLAFIRRKELYYAI